MMAQVRMHNLEQGVHRGTRTDSEKVLPFPPYASQIIIMQGVDKCLGHRRSVVSALIAIREGVRGAVGGLRPDRSRTCYAS